MTDIRNKVFQSFCQITNRLKRAGYTPQNLSPESFLGGELGIDSIEMLEIWYDLEQELGIHIDDEAKRDIYTVGEAIDVVTRIVEAGSLVQA